MHYIKLPNRAFKGKKSSKYYVFILLLIPIILSILFVLSIKFGITTMAIITFVLFICYLLLVSKKFYYEQINNRINKHRKIAKANGFTYDVETSLIEGDSILSNLHKAQVLQHVLSGYILNVPFNKVEFIHNYQNPQNKYDTTTNGTALIIYLNRQVPHIIAWSKLARFRDDYTDAYTSSNLSLEGAFGEQFTMSVPKNYERDALYIFTPELMHQILLFAPDADIELYNDRAILYLWDYKAIEKEDFERLAEIVANIGAELIDNTNNYIDDRAVNRQKRSQQILKGEIPDEPLVVHDEGNDIKKSFLYREL